MDKKNIWISTPISSSNICYKMWKEQYIGHFETKMEEIDITIDEAIDKYGIRRERIGYDRGILFNSVAMKIDKMGNYKVVEYLPRGCNSKKNDMDFLYKYSKGIIMESEAQKIARRRNWQIYMFRGMAYRICQLTRNLSDNKLSTKDKIIIVNFNEIMHKQIDYLDSIKKHRHSYGLVFSLGKDICSECGKIKYSRGNQRQCF